VAAVREAGHPIVHDVTMTTSSNAKFQVEFRRATPGDYSAILSLQSANHIANLAPDERNDGFLSAEFTLGQVEEMAQDLGTTIAVVGTSLAGFLCAFRREFQTGSPVIAKMLEAYDAVQFDGKPLSRSHSYIYGPVCIGREYRRGGLLRGLYEAQLADLSGQFEVGVAFVARNNPHSLEAHIAGLGMTDVGDFQVRGNSYVILAFRVPR
jgi:hypothetical protein